MLFSCHFSCDENVPEELKRLVVSRALEVIEALRSDAATFRNLVSHLGDGILFLGTSLKVGDVLVEALKALGYIQD